MGILHLKYILNKYNIITILVIMVIYLFSLLINILNVQTEDVVEVIRNTYFYNVTLILKLVVIILIVFVIALSSTNYQESYQLFIISSRKERVKFYLSKILVLFIITTLIILILFTMFVLVGLIGSKWFVIEEKHISFFVFLELNSFMYGMFTYNLIKLLNNLFVVIIPCFIVIFEEAFMYSELTKVISYVFPIIENGINPTMSYGIIHVIILIICYIGIGLMRCYTLDIK